jgi:hypothetical protein
VLLDQNPLTQGLCSISVENGHRPLEHDWPIVQLPSNEVDRHAADFDAMFDRLTLCVDTREGRKKGRVDVHNRVRERLNKWLADDPHVSSQADKPDAAEVQLTGKRAIMIVARFESTVIEMERLDTGGASALESACLRAIGNHDDNFGIEPSVTCRVDHRLQVAAAAGNQDPKPALHDRLT